MRIWSLFRRNDFLCRWLTDAQSPAHVCYSMKRHPSVFRSGEKTFWGRSIFCGVTFFFDQKCWGQNFWGHHFFGGQMFGGQSFLGDIISLGNTIWGFNCLGQQLFRGQQFWDNNFFRGQKCWDKNVQVSKNVTGQINCGTKSWG